jgi:hypothetical protein
MISRQHHIALQNGIFYALCRVFSTYDHRTLKTRLPVRSALFKQRTGGLVVRWVTTSEYPLLYVFFFFFGSSLVEVWPLFFGDAGRTRGEEGKLVQRVYQLLWKIYLNVPADSIILKHSKQDWPLELQVFFHLLLPVPLLLTTKLKVVLRTGTLALSDL